MNLCPLDLERRSDLVQLDHERSKQAVRAHRAASWYWGWWNCVLPALDIWDMRGLTTDGASGSNRASNERPAYHVRIEKMPDLTL